MAEDTTYGTWKRERDHLELEAMESLVVNLRRGHRQPSQESRVLYLWLICFNPFAALIHVFPNPRQFGLGAGAKDYSRSNTM